LSDPTTPATPAGWYPDSTPGQERYWDGVAWSPTMIRPAAPPTEAAVTVADPNVGTIQPPAKKPWYKRKLIVIPAAVLLGIIVLSSIVNSVNGDDDPVAGTKPSAIPGSIADGKTEEPEPEPEEVVDTRVEMPSLVGMTVADARAAATAAGYVLDTTAPDNAVVETQAPSAGEKREAGAAVSVTGTVPLSLAQQNVIRQAQSYLKYSGFSREGLIGQLEYEGYSPEDSAFGADNAGADWNAEAAEKAADYLKYSSFSREGLYEQMAYEKFTAEQIEFALAAVGY
jgi:hypothetical protein